MSRTLLAERAADTADLFLCFDANLPKLEKCEPNCTTKRNVLCVHRFNHKVQVEHCNTKRFQGWSDLRVFTYFIGRIFESIAEGLVAPESVFILLTKDRNFIDDVKSEWEATDAKTYLDLVFSGNSISHHDLIVFIQQIDCPNYGNKRTDDLKCTFYKVNNFLTQQPEA